MSFIHKEDPDQKGTGIASVLHNLHAALWEFDLRTKQLRCSAGFYIALGLESQFVDLSYAYFISHIVYHEDVSVVTTETYNCLLGKSKTLEIRLFTANGYQWFQSTFTRDQDTTITGTIVNIHQYKISEYQLTASNRQYAAVNKITKAGSWEIDARSRVLTLSKEAAEILELPLLPAADIDSLIRTVIPEHRPIMERTLNDCINIGKPCNVELQVRTGSKNTFWVKVSSFTTVDEYGKVQLVRGIIQNIDQVKRRETELLASFEFADHQNKRLQNFAYMVSHNLRSHANNLQYLVRLYQESEEPDEQKEIFKHIFAISNSLNTTIEHLNQIVKIESDIKQERQRTDIESLLKNVLNALDSNIQSADAQVHYDFTACPSIMYIPAYLESIFHNLLTNSLKYRDPERKVVISCYSKEENGNVYLIFEDNGTGIDLERYGKKLFGMYQTFHKNTDSKGIGLFLTRNQIEAMGGSIEVESTLNEGTKFTIRLGTTMQLTNGVQ
ncbi:ATP-binding protein [Mucilaginibacter sp. CSA2-8R]|uniref:PAS domain-containing sensor histidine kinase n=1 Tax=Mucilaginibacter sp. CSA2-8R TaxID=3141542 RepID=UPI00315D67B7